MFQQRTVKCDLLQISQHPRHLLIGPSAYNVHCNDLIVTLEDLCEIFNYADDNTVTCHGKTVTEVKEKAEIVINKMLDWFKVNQMKVTDDKFQYIVFCRNKTISGESVRVGSNEIMSRSCQSCVKLLAAYFDLKLIFDYHVDDLCQKDGRKLSVLARLTNTLHVANKMLLFHTYIYSIKIMHWRRRFICFIKYNLVKIT